MRPPDKEGYFALALLLMLVLQVSGGQPPPEDGLPIAELQYEKSRRLVHLNNDYGFAIRWRENESLRCYLYDKDQQQIISTTSLAEFLRGLAEFPDGAQVAWLHKCGAPLHYGMPEKMMARIDHLIREKRFKLAGPEQNNFIVCTCESKQLRLFDRVLAVPPVKPQNSLAMPKDVR